jgi:hypothetical protein
MTQLDARSVGRWLRATVALKPVPIIVAAMFLLFGLYPGPALFVLHSPAWRNDAVVNRLAEERAFWVAGLFVIVGPAIVLANLVPDRFDRMWNAVRDRMGSVRDRWFIIGVAGFAMLAAAVASIYMLSRKPTTSDEVAQLWHARILLSGRLWLPADPNPEFFAVDNVIDHGRWYSQFPIAGPALVALAMLVHAAWLLNPLLSGLTVVNVHRFASVAYGTAAARASAILCATCPFLMLMSGSYMNHTLVVFLTTLALAELPAWVNGSSRRRLAASIVIGVALGLAIAVRPLDGAIAAFALGCFMIYVAVRHAHVPMLVVVVAAAALPVGGMLVTNMLTTGRPLLFGYEVLWGANHSLGFHNDPSGNPHTPARALALATVYLMQLNWSLFEWPIAGLLVVAGALIVIRSLDRWDALLLAWIGVQLASYAAYWHAGALFGPRYLFTVVPALLLFAGRGLAVAEQAARPAVRRGVVAAVTASILSSWLIRMPPVGARGGAEAIRPTRLAFKRDLDSVVDSLGGRKALVFISETSSSRLMRRMWGLGISRPDAARLAATKDHCALLDIVLDEEPVAASPRERLARLDAAKSYAPPEGWRLMVADIGFRTSNRESITPRCRAEILSDNSRGAALSYGPALLMNEIGRDGRIAGPIVFVADLGEHNDVLRARFGDRSWYRLEAQSETGDELPRLVPYQ